MRELFLTLTILAGKDSISDAFWAKVSKLISLDALLLLRVIWMTPPAVTWLSPPLCVPATPFWDGGGSFEAWDQIFVEGGPSGDCPSLDKRRERRGAVCCASEVSAGFVATFSGDGTGADDTVHVWASGSCCGSTGWTSSFLDAVSGGHGSEGG